MKKLIFGLLVWGLGGLVGCSFLSHFPVQEGNVLIVIRRPSLETTAIEPNYIPSNAEYVRIRIWHKTTGVNVAGTVSVEIRVPANTGYIVDAVSYVVQGAPAYGFLLTGGRVANVDVVANSTTAVDLVLGTWFATFSGDTSVSSGEIYTVTAQISHKDQMFRDFFRAGAAFLLASLYSYQTPSATLPPPVAVGTISNGRITLSATAPNVTEPSTLYCSILAHLSEQWYDPAYPDVAVALEIPNRQMGERLHEIQVNPPEGGIIIGISEE